MQKLSDDPTIYTIENYITLEECEHMINISKDKIAPSLVSGSKSGYISKGRTGQNCWISHDHDDITSKIAERISNEVGISLKNTEAFQVIYYDVDQEYKQHYDSWDFDKSERSIRNMKYGGQRMVTALVYLNDVEEGGGTKFTKLGKEVKAEKGKLLIFHNVIKGTNIRHKMSEHAGMPVLKGEKWAFNLWFREQDKKLEYDYKEKTFENLSEPKNTKQDEQIEQIEKTESKQIDSNDILNQYSFSNINLSNKNNQSYEIKSYENVLSSDDLFDILINSNFENKEKSTVWICKKKMPNLIEKISKLIQIDSAFFENIQITKYAENVVHGDHLDAYDITSNKGIENTKITGQRLITITGFLTNCKVSFPKIQKNYNMKKGELLVYNNCYNESNKRNENMIKNYSQSKISNNKLETNSDRINPSFIILFNIYVREKSRTSNNILKITNGMSESIIEESKEENKCVLSTEELINLIYTRNPLENLRIPGFKIANKAPILYLQESLSKIKSLRDQNTMFLNSVNLEKEYFIDEYNPVVVEDVIIPEIHKIVDEYFKTNIKNGVYPFGDRQSQRYKLIDEIITRLLHLEFLPLIEKIVEKKMEPTYTYISAYTKGADLPAHTDRPECEFTCSYIIGKPPNSNWDIYVHKVKQPVKYKGRYAKFENGDPGYTPPKEECIAVDCNQNGLMIFNGTDHIHYREPLEHEYYNIVLLHYKVKSSL